MCVNPIENNPLRTKYYHISKLDVSINAITVKTGEDLCVIVTGGMAHIGSVSMAVPRESLDGGKNSSTVSTFNFTGHKDDVIGNRFASQLCSKICHHVSVICGVHFDNCTAQMIELIIQTSDELLEQIIQDR